MIKRRLAFILWTTFLSFLFISMGSIEQTIHASLFDQSENTAPDTALHNADIAFVFDLNGVLFDTNRSTVFRQLGIKDTLLYVATNGSSKIKEKFFQTLNRVYGSQGNSCNVNDTDGTLLPELMVHWLRGTMSSNKIGSRVVKAIAQHPEWFASSTEQRLMTRMTYSIFNPQQFVASRTPLSSLVPFIKSLKKQGVQLYVLSNWDRESFPLMREKYNDLFELFDGIIISGDIGYVKPQPEIFNYLKKHIPAKTICLIDDQQENLDAARDAGLYTIQVRKNGYLSSGIDANAVIEQSSAILNLYRSGTALATIN